MSFGLPQALVLAAALVALLGIRKLSRPSVAASLTTKQSLLVWFLRLAGRLSVWLVATRRPL